VFVAACKIPFVYVTILLVWRLLSVAYQRTGFKPPEDDTKVSKHVGV